MTKRWIERSRDDKKETQPQDGCVSGNSPIQTASDLFPDRHADLDHDLCPDDLWGLCHGGGLDLGLDGHQAFLDACRAPNGPPVPSTPNYCASPNACSSSSSSSFFPRRRAVSAGNPTHGRSIVGRDRPFASREEPAGEKAVCLQSIESPGHNVWNGTSGRAKDATTSRRKKRYPPRRPARNKHRCAE